jgi:hypothetical protein
MLQLSVPIPNITGRQEIEIDMTINGQKQKMHFMIEVYPWKMCPSDQENRIQCIRDLVRDYGQEWTIYDIGIPTEKYVPLTFVKTEDWNRQRKALVAAVMG